MMTKINIPPPLRQYAGKQPAVEVKAGTVAEALSGLVSKHPELRKHLYTEDKKLRSFVNVYLNEEDVRFLKKKPTPLKGVFIFWIVPSIAGGGETHARGRSHSANAPPQRLLLSVVLL